MGTEIEFTYATKPDAVTLDLTGTPTLNRQGYVPDTGTKGFSVHFNYSGLFDIALMHLHMQGQKPVVVEIPNPMDPNGFDMGGLMDQEGFFIRQSRHKPVGELIIGQLADGRKSELRTILSPHEPGRASVGIKIDLIDPATGRIDPTSRSEHERKGIPDAQAAEILKRFCEGRELKKAFHDLPNEPQPGVHCYLQEFKTRAHLGLVLAEFEMSEAVARTFKPPSWLKQAFNVTAVPDFRTKALALGGGMWRRVFNSLSRAVSRSPEPAMALDIAA